MAQTVHLKLKANGSDVQGESSQTSEGRENTIECTYFESSMDSGREVQSGIATARRQHKPLVIRKRIDKSTPLIAKALTHHQVIEGEFLFFRPNPAGDGTTEQYYTVKISNGRVHSQKMISEWSNPGAEHAQPPMEEVAFVFQNIQWRYTNGGVEHEDTWEKG
ncbi:MAG TPA: type VI secretion system tube protein TssD [Myxococcales bacterium]|jgi:type VI secretion system secreted protein Hcp|nr:type VI secretion system tube protein TssD [Myxococcales bacterium]